MAGRVKNFFQNLKTNKNKMSILLIVLVFILFGGFNIAFAFYNDLTSQTVIGSKVGDFDFGDGDVGVLFYKETAVNSNEYERAYSIPMAYYYFDDTQTVCNIDCNVKDNDNHIIENQACKYEYIPAHDEEPNKMAITSNEQVTCKFFFRKSADTDTSINIMVENANGATTYKNNNYDVALEVPATGYTYFESECDVPATVTYNEGTQDFTIESTVPNNNCRVYFNTAN